MDEFIKLLDPAYELIQYRIKEDKVIFHIASTITELECPFCGRKTPKVHSIYEREIQDLPMQGKNTANRSLRIKFAHEKRREGLTISDMPVIPGLVDIRLL